MVWLEKNTNITNIFLWNKGLHSLMVKLIDTVWNEKSINIYSSTTQKDSNDKYNKIEYIDGINVKAQ